MGAWIGWHDCDPASRPTVAGQTYLGVRGTQQAECLACVGGLHAVLAYARIERTPPEQLVLHVDNEWLANVLKGEWHASDLRAYHQHAEEVISALRELGIEFMVEHVTERHPQHKIAHSMSKSAWNQVLHQTTWRPAAKPPDAPLSPPSPTQPGTAVDYTG